MWVGWQDDTKVGSGLSTGKAAGKSQPSPLTQSPPSHHRLLTPQVSGTHCQEVTCQVTPSRAGATVCTRATDCLLPSSHTLLWQTLTARQPGEEVSSVLAGVDLKIICSQGTAHEKSPPSPDRHLCQPQALRCGMWRRGLLCRFHNSPIRTSRDYGSPDRFSKALDLCSPQFP